MPCSSIGVRFSQIDSGAVMDDSISSTTVTSIYISTGSINVIYCVFQMQLGSNVPVIEFEIPFPVLPPASTALRFTRSFHIDPTLKIVALAGSISVTVILSEDVHNVEKLISSSPKSFPPPDVF